VRPNPIIAQGVYYVALWLLYPAFAMRLSFLVNTLSFPLRDQQFADADALVGFDWVGWAKFVYAHPAFHFIQEISYASHFWQPLVLILIFSVWGPRTRNAELLTAVILAVLLTMGLDAFLPAIGPMDANGIQAEGKITLDLRHGVRRIYDYAGIIAFPSFHTVMALLFTWAARDRLETLFPAIILNGLMLISIPVVGDHYLVDMIGGAVVTALSIVGQRKLTAYQPQPNVLNQSLETKAQPRLNAAIDPTSNTSG
jgi:hypothetical protein